MFDPTNAPPTAGDLMCRDVDVIPDDLPLPDAAARLARREARPAPVVDAAGRCVGVLAAADITRGVAVPGDAVPRSPACGYQATHREPRGRETVLCQLAEGVCPLQERRALTGGSGLACVDPYSVPTDWQVVRPGAQPGSRVRDAMTTGVVTADPDTPVGELARLMNDHGVHHLVVIGDGRQPVGVVSASDLLRVPTFPEQAVLAETA